MKARQKKNMILYIFLKKYFGKKWRGKNAGNIVKIAEYRQFTLDTDDVGFISLFLVLSSILATQLRIKIDYSKRTISFSAQTGMI